MHGKHIAEDELLDSVYYLFSSSALNWYEANYHKFTSWSSLEQALKCLQQNYDFQFRREIEEKEFEFILLSYPIDEQH